MTWQQAMRTALYAPGGFYARGEVAARHFRTSVHASGRYASAIVAILREVDLALGHPDQLDLVDVGGSRGELLGQVLTAAALEPELARRIVPCAVEVTERPPDADRRIRWRKVPPARITGLVVASEWLDNIPIDVAELTSSGPLLLQVDTGTGDERPGPPPTKSDLAWLRTWWRLREVGDRAEIGQTRGRAWAALVRRISRGVAICADYGHLKATRPGGGTLSSYRDGRSVPVIPDGSCDITAHVALDACEAAGHKAGAGFSMLTTQRQGLRALGIRGARPAWALSTTDPEAYVQALVRASEEAELLDARGLGGFGWLVQAVGMTLPESLVPLVSAWPQFVDRSPWGFQPSLPELGLPSMRAGVA